MGRLLDEDDVIDWLLKRTEMYDATGHFVDENVVKKNIESQIAKIPSAQPDLSEYSDKLWRNAYERGKREAQTGTIQCKDCKYLDVQGTYGECDKGLLGIVNRDDFCSRAERREE